MLCFGLYLLLDSVLGLYEFKTVYLSLNTLIFIWVLHYSSYRDEVPKFTSISGQGLKSNARGWEGQVLAWYNIEAIKRSYKILPFARSKAKVLFRGDQDRLTTLSFHVENEIKRETEQFQTVLNHYWSDWRRP